MKHRTLQGLATVTALILFIAGCATTGNREYAESSSVEPEPKPVRIELPEVPADLTPVQDRSDLNEIIRFGLALSDADRHEEAAQVFIKASNEFRSKGGALEQDLVKAAICEHWLAGNLKAVRKNFEYLARHRQDLYDKLNEKETIRRIRAIAMPDK